MKVSDPLSDPSILDAPRARSQARRYWLLLVRVVAIVLVAVLGYKVVRVGLLGLSAYRQVTELRALRADGDLDSADLVRAAAAVNEISRAVASIEREQRPFAPVLRATRVVPGIGPTLAAVPELLVAGRELVTVAGESLRLAVPVA